MDDVLRRELGGIGALLRGIFRRVRSVSSGPDETPATGAELAASRSIDLDALLADPDPADLLVRRHGFAEAEVEVFAEWLASLAAATEGEERLRLAATACALYKHQDAHGAPAPPSRLHILRELASYSPDKP